MSLLLRYVTKVISPQSVNEACAAIFPDYLWGAQVSKHCAREAPSLGSLHTQPCPMCPLWAAPLCLHTRRTLGGGPQLIS